MLSILRFSFLLVYNVLNGLPQHQNFPYSVVRTRETCVAVILVLLLIGFSIAIMSMPTYTPSWRAGVACLLERRTRDRKVASSNPGRSDGRIFFSRVNFVCWLLFGVRFTPVLPLLPTTNYFCTSPSVNSNGSVLNFVPPQGGQSERDPRDSDLLPCVDRPQHLHHVCAGPHPHSCTVWTLPVRRNR